MRARKVGGEKTEATREGNRTKIQESETEKTVDDKDRSRHSLMMREKERKWQETQGIREKHSKNIVRKREKNERNWCEDERRCFANTKTRDRDTKNKTVNKEWKKRRNRERNTSFPDISIHSVSGSSSSVSLLGLLSFSPTEQSVFLCWSLLMMLVFRSYSIHEFEEENCVF